MTGVQTCALPIYHISFPDHHQYSIDDLSQFREKLDEITGGNKILVTTEKDAMRLYKNDLVDVVNTLPLYIIPIEIDFKDKTQDFNELLLNYARTNKFHHKKYS